MPSICARQAELEEDKRYSQLVDMMAHFNSDFDERRYWAYGCNCLILGDRPMSRPGHGPPVDDLDSSCKRYKDCVKCAKEKFGDNCISEFRRYRYTKPEGVQCTDNAGTCLRALCECDATFAEDHAKYTHV